MTFESKKNPNFKPFSDYQFEIEQLEYSVSNSSHHSQQMSLVREFDKWHLRDR